MIAACSRLDRLLKAVRPLNAFSNPAIGHQVQVWHHCQRLSCTWTMSSKKHRSTEMDHHKKQKTITRTWRPISTQSITHEVDHDERPDLQCQPPEQQKNTTSGVSDEQMSNQEESVMDRTKAADLDNQDGKYLVYKEVDASLIRFIKGKGGSMQRQVERDLGVKIVFAPSKRDNYIAIEGTVENVAKASEEIASIIKEAVNSPKLDYSHFVSLPLAIHPDLIEKLNRFQNSILGDAAGRSEDDLENDSSEDNTEDKDNQPKSHNVAVKLEVEGENEHIRVKMDATQSKSSSSTSTLSDMGIERSIFIKPKTFHLTVLMLKLWNKERIATASEVLRRVSSKVQDALENQPVSIRLKGLMCMRGSPAKARVVYAPVEEIGGEGRLMRACQVITDAYVEAGLVLEKDAQHSLKLHATLMNVRHRERKGRTKGNDSFDARHIFRVYGSEDWGEYHIPVVHLSQRFEFDESGYYHCCASIPLPESMLSD